MNKREHLILTIAGGLCLLAVLGLLTVRYLNQRQAARLANYQAVLQQAGPALEQETSNLCNAIGERSISNPRMKEILTRYGIQYTPPAANAPANTTDKKGGAR